MPDRDRIEAKLSRLPDGPGVYIMKDLKGRILYIGKAVSLKKRVRSYFRKNPDSVKTRFLAEKIADIDFYTVTSELEALILEANLVQREQPPYNIRLKDDKQYPSLAVTHGPYPRLVTVRNKKDHYPKYFGPYTSSRALGQALDFINKNFKLRKCERELAFGRVAGKPCLYYQMGQCLAPCQGNIPEEDYRRLVDEVILFLNEEYGKLVPRLEERMGEASRRLDFETAARLRDTIRDIRHVSQRQDVNLPHTEDMDIVCLANRDDLYCFLAAFVRQGRITGRRVYFHTDRLGIPSGEAGAAFLRSFYAGAEEIPPKIVTAFVPPDAKGIGRWLSAKTARPVILRAPAGEQERRIVRLLEANARLQLEEHAIEEMSLHRKRNLNELKTILGLGRLPRRIEAFDISNLGAANPVASMVSFKDGVPDKSNYRRFKIKFTAGQNDFAMIEEVVGRRYQRLLNEKKPLPDLALIDGGPGQLKAARESLVKLGLKNLPLVSLAKKEEIIHRLDSEKPVRLSKDSPALQLLQSVRDEAHRFAVSFHRKLRSKAFLPQKRGHR